MFYISSLKLHYALCTFKKIRHIDEVKGHAYFYGEMLISLQFYVSHTLHVFIFMSMLESADSQRLL